MNKKQYNNVIDWTLKHDQAAKSDDSLETARAIFKNMGVALPGGSMQEVFETIKTNNYMGWKACTMEEAQQAADKGVAAIGISENQIVVLTANDEDEPVAQTASVMTLSENNSADVASDLQYFTYSNESTATVVDPIICNLTLGIHYRHTLQQGGEHWYQFTALENRTYSFTITKTNSIIPEVYLEDVLLGGSYIRSDNSFSVSARLIKGLTYKLQVRGLSEEAYGDYGLCVKDWAGVQTPQILARATWNPREPNMNELEIRDATKTKRIIFHHSADNFSNTDQDAVKAEIRRIQNMHMDDPDEPYADIGYHYIIDPAGRVWEGRSLDYKGAHAYGYNNDIGVLVLGDFHYRIPLNLFPNELNQQQKDAMTTFSKWLCYQHDLIRIDSGMDIAPISMHRIVDSGNECPGDNIATWIENNLQNVIMNWGS